MEEEFRKAGHVRQAACAPESGVAAFSFWEVMLTRTVEIEVEDLTLGMYVSELDRPWVETPFLFQGFRIQHQEEIDTLKKFCARVRIDITVGEMPKPKARVLSHRENAAAVQSNEILRRRRKRKAEARRPTQEEMGSAREAHEQMVETLSDVMQGLQEGRTLAIEQVQASAKPLIDSIERNPDALAYLMTMRRKDVGMHRHAMSTAVLVLTCGRHLGLARAELETLALGGLLFDVGKTRVSDTVLLKPDRLTDEEFGDYKRHVEYGIETLSRCRGVNDAVLSMVRTHHERHDGSGYPLGLKGDSIPAFGKIVGIADAYQSMLESNTAGRRLSAHDVLNYLNKHRGLQFDSALVEEFIQAIGIYPTGTLVKLSDGCVGVVVEQNRLRRLQPKVMLVLDQHQQRLPAFATIDLLTHDTRAQQLQIVECLEPGAFGIDPEELFL
ncbi:MAG: HD-GYP domain-containing protein [Gammaproteobacteria bacterium]